jgi:heme-degrading monooxygenase HmoA
MLTMYVSLSRLHLDPGLAPDLVDAFKRRAHLVDDAAGFIDLEVWQSDKDAGELIMVSRWANREAFKAYMKSEEHQRSHARIHPSLDDAIKLERLEHLHTYDVVAT